MGLKLPLSKEQVETLVRFQTSPYVHHLTCRNTVHDGGPDLIPTPQGLICPSCGEIQTIIPDLPYDEIVEVQDAFINRKIISGEGED